MPSKTDQILAEMRICTPPEKIDDSSKSSYYKAYTIFKPEADATLRKTYDDIKAADTQKKAIQAEIERCKPELATLKQAITVETAKYEKTKTSHIALMGQNTEIKAQKDAMESRLADLGRRGITEKTIEAVASTDATGDLELLTRVQTAKDAQELTKENEKLEAKKIELTKKVSDEGTNLEAAKRETQSEANRRDEFRRINTLYIALLDLLFDFFKRGYTFEHFRLLLNGLKRLEIVGQPRNTMTRLLNAFEKIQTLEELDAVIQLKQATLATLQATINELRGMIDAYRDGAVASLNQISTTATKKMEALLNQYCISMNTLHENILSSLSKISVSTQAERATVINTFSDDLRKAKNDVLSVHKTVTQALQIYQNEVFKYGEILRESGHYEQLIQNTSALLTATKDPSIIKKLPPEFIISLLKGINFYIQTRLPDAETIPSQELYKKERWAFSSIYKAKIRSVSEWLLEDLTKRFNEGEL